MKKIITLVLFAVFASTIVMAIPAQRRWRTVTQPDGTKLRVMLVGDERLHYFITEDQVPVLEKRGAYYYADGIGFGMKASVTMAHDVEQRSAYEAKVASAASVKHIENVRPFSGGLFRAPNRLRHVDGQAATSSDFRPYSGRHKSLVILAQFADKKFRAEHDSAYYDASINQVGYVNEQGAIGSIHDFFTDQSHGMLDLTFDIVGPVTLDYGYAHYGADDDYWEFGAEAIQKAADMRPDLNWSDYDWNGDGEVENLYIVYAGYGEATGGSSSTIWPAQTSFDEYNVYAAISNEPTYDLNFGGMHINTFACGNEMSGGGYGYADEPQGIGTMTHEFSHCLGYPDLYDTDNNGYTNGNFGMGIWSIMDYGSYGGPNYNAWVPVGYTAYEKWAAGWLDFTELTGENDSVKSLRSTYNGGTAYVIYNDSVRAKNNPDASEYFLFENRTKSRWDSYLPAQGLEVLHVNYVKRIWDDNSVNSAGNSNRKQNCTIVAADNRYGSSSQYSRSDDRFDLFPYNKLDSITPNSTPRLTFYNRQKNKEYDFDKPIAQIRWNAADSTVSFIYNPVDTMMTPAPKINGKRGFRDSTVVTITAPKGFIKYSTDSTNFTDYTGPLTLKDSTSIWAYAWREGKNNSDTVRADFIKQVQLRAPVISGDTAFTTPTTVVTISAPEGRLRYSTNGRYFLNYSKPFTINRTTTVYAYATSNDEGHYNSDTVRVVFRKVEHCAIPVIELTADSTGISITSDEPEGQIWFSTDSIHFNEYSGVIALTADSMTVWAYVTAEGKVASDTVSYTFTRSLVTDGIGRIVLFDAYQGDVRVYTLDGRYVGDAGKSKALRLRRGAYIVRDSEGKARKMVVK